jgi:hypothetical protein
MTEHELILKAREAIKLAEQLILQTIELVCPGPHKPFQHRDMKPPWCSACGYTNTGYRAEDYTVTVTN